MRICFACGHENPDSESSCQACNTDLSGSIGDNPTIVKSRDIKDFSAGDIIAGRYQVVRILGQGGMGVVYLAHDQALRDNRIALKMVHPGLLTNPEALKRFEEEVLISQSLTHSNIVRVHDLKRTDGLRFFTMEFIDGPSLRQWIDRRKAKQPPFTLPEVMTVIDPLLDALSYAHKFTVHRDVKPENIMVQGEFPAVTVKLLDFGIARTMSVFRFTQTSQAMGTAYYMAPEQMTGAAEVDLRADLYSVGMILYEMLTGKMAVGRFRLPGELVDGLPKKLDAFIEKALAPEPEQRYPTAAIMRADLAAIGQSAEHEYRREIERQENDNRIGELLLAGRTAFNRRRWKKAATILEELVELDGTNAEASQLLTAARDNQAELERLQQALANAEQAADYHNALLATDRLLGLVNDPSVIQKKIRLFKEVYEDQTQRAQDQKTGAMATLCQSALYDRQWAKAAGFADQMLKLDPAHAAASDYLKLARQNQAALEALTAKFNTAKEDRDAHQALEILDRLAPLSPHREELEAERRRLILENVPKLDSPPGKRIKSYRRRILLLAAFVAVVFTGFLAFNRYGTKTQPKITPAQPPTQQNSLGRLQDEATPPETRGNFWTEPVTGMQFVWVPGGCYQMGCGSWTGDCSNNEQPVHEVCLDGFWIGKYEVTQSQWQKIMGSNPSKFKKGDDFPVEQVSWNDAQAFIEKLNARGNGQYRLQLPTEAQWEYAARSGGRPERYAGGGDVDRLAWYGANSGGSTRRVGTRAPNGLGLYDMSGNVWEWCQDTYDENAYTRHSRNNPESTSGGSLRVYRGGGWIDGPGGVRCAYRNWIVPGDRYGDLGLRLSRTP